MKRILQFLTLIALIVGVIVSVTSISKPVAFVQYDGVANGILREEDNVQFMLLGNSQVFVIYFDDVPGVDVNFVEGEQLTVKVRQPSMETQRIVVQQLTVGGVEIFSNVQQSLDENRIVGGGFAFCLCMLIVCLVVIMTRHYEDGNYTPMDFSITNPHFVGEMGYFFATMCVAPSMYVVLMVLLQKTPVYNLGFLMVSAFIFALSCLLIYIYKWEFFQLKNGVYCYRKPFRKTHRISREEVFAVQFEQRKHTLQFRVVFLDANGKSIFSFIDDGTCLKHNYFIDSLMQYGIPLRVKEEDEIVTLDYDQLNNTEEQQA